MIRSRTPLQWRASARARILYPLLNAARIAYWFIVRPRTAGAVCLVTNHDAFLLVRNSYGPHRWTLPGGGIRHGESPHDAVAREVYEETGIMLDAIEHLGTYESTEEYKHDTVHAFHARVNSPETHIDRKEVIDAAWFTREALPHNLWPLHGCATALESE